ncbi:MAG: M23 family metallopeptidase [Akkermansiaceae bacterium]|nr:M23 family metallopeptidase [Akkermansiaceae bacterium]
MRSSAMRPKKAWTRLAFFILLAAGVLLLGFAWLSRRAALHREAIAAAPTAYDADAAPPTMPDTLLTGLILLTPEQMVNAPLIDGFSAPLGGETGAMTYDAQPFGTWNEQYGGRHQGQDLNGIGGMDTDRGEPVYSAARGLVVYTGKPSRGWGNVVVLAHRLPDGRLIQTLYAHLETVKVTYGRMVSRGEEIGSVGTAGEPDAPYPAHLHFEAAESLAVEAGMPGYASAAMNRIDPAELMKQYPAPFHGALPDPWLSLRRLILSGETGVQAVPQLPEGKPGSGFWVDPSRFLKQNSE